MAFWRLLSVWMLLWPLSVSAAEIAVSSGQSLLVTRFDQASDTLVIWLPSERGFDQGATSLGQSLAESGQAVWTVNLHDSYMIPTGRSSIEQFNPQDVADLIEQAGKEGYRKVMFFAASRGVRLAIRASRLWQSQGKADPRLIGMVALYPHLTMDGQRVGDDVRYLPESRAFNLPTYLLQPEFSTKYAHIDEIRAALEEGGSSVFIQRLRGVQGGFHVRSDAELTPTDKAAKARFPWILKQAGSLMAAQPRPASPAPLPAAEGASSAPSAATLFSGGLQSYAGNPTPGAIDLLDLNGHQVSSADWQGDTVLLNFWATWCGPCVHEIPSLSRLQQRMKGKPFRIVSVNIGESPERIKSFAEKVPIDFPVLLDELSQTARDWDIYAYPSNYLLDPRGRITHAYRGALEWDEEQVVQTILDAMKMHEGSVP